MLRSAYRALLNLSRVSDLTVRSIPVWPALARAPKYRQLLEIQDQLNRTEDALGVNLPMVSTPSLLNKVVTRGVRIRDLEDLTGGVHSFVLFPHTADQREIVLTGAKRYSTFVGGGTAPSLANANILAAPYVFSLPITFLQARGQLTRTRVICTCTFGVNAAIVGKLAYLVSRIQE